MEAEGYDVLRLIEHGKLCYTSSDHIIGKPFIKWMKYHPNISKELLFSWMRDILRQLGQFHRLRGAPCYKYMNPYSMIVSEEKKLYLLDTGADSNQAIIKQMQRRTVRESFLPSTEPFYQKESIHLDIHGLGKTLQYILAVTDPEPALTKKEERAFKRIISRCLIGQTKKTYQNIPDILKHFPTYKEIAKKEKPKTKKRLVTILAIVVVITSCTVWYQTKEVPKVKERKELEEVVVEKKKVTKQAVDEQSVEDKQRVEDQANMAFDMGMLYLLEVENYEKSRESFRTIEHTHESAKDYELIATWLSGKKEGSLASFKDSLLRAEENLPMQGRQSCYRVLLRAYALLDSKESAQSVIRLGTACEELGEKEETLDEITEKELAEFMAAAYEELGEVESAAQYYEKQLVLETTEAAREELYQKLAMLWEGADRLDVAGTTCLKGIEEYQASAKLRVAHIRMICKDAGVAREVCAQTIQEYIKAIPEILEQEEFKKLQQEYEIKVEGEQVWVGR